MRYLFGWMMLFSMESSSYLMTPLNHCQHLTNYYSAHQFGRYFITFSSYNMLIKLGIHHLYNFRYLNDIFHIVNMDVSLNIGSREPSLCVLQENPHYIKRLLC